MVSGTCQRQTTLVLPQRKPRSGVTKGGITKKHGIESKQAKTPLFIKDNDWFTRSSIDDEISATVESEFYMLGNSDSNALTNLVFTPSKIEPKEIARRTKLNRYMMMDEKKERELRKNRRYMDAVEALSTNHDSEARENKALNALWRMLRKIAEGREYDKVLRREKRPIRNRVCGRTRTVVNQAVANKRRTETRTAAHPDCVLCEIGGVCGTSLKRWHDAYMAMDHDSIEREISAPAVGNRSHPYQPRRRIDFS